MTLRSCLFWAFGLGLTAGLQSVFADVCDRTPEVVAELERTIGKPCEAILASDISQISDFSVSGKKLTSVQTGDFSGMSGVNYFDMSENLLIGLPGDLFHGVPQMAEVLLGDNHLRSLPKGLFQGLSGLGYIYLVRNELTALPVELFQGLSALETLDLSMNQLSTLPRGMFSGLKSLKYLFLLGNPIPAQEQAQIRSELPPSCQVSF